MANSRGEQAPGQSEVEVVDQPRLAGGGQCWLADAGVEEDIRAGPHRNRGIRSGGWFQQPPSQRGPGFHAPPGANAQGKDGVGQAQ